MSLPHTFRVLNILFKVEKIFLLYRFRSENDSIYINSLKIIYVIASTVLFASIIVISYIFDYFKEFANGTYEANLVYMVIQVIEYYLIVGIAYLNRDRQLRMTNKIKNIFKLLPTRKHNSDFNQWKYTANILVWQVISISYLLLNFYSIYISGMNWMLNAFNYWYALTKFTHDSNIVVSTFTYINISEAIFRMDYVVKNVITKYRSTIKLNKKTKIYEKHVCDEINVLIKIYDEIFECTEDANLLFGLTNVMSLATIYTFNLLNIFWTATLSMEVLLANLLNLSLSSVAIPLMSVSGESIFCASRFLRCDLARLFQITPINSKVRENTKCFIRTVKTQIPKQHVCGFIDVRMSLLVGFLTLTASNTIVMLQFTHVV